MSPTLLSARDIQVVVARVGLDSFMDQLIGALEEAFARYDPQRCQTPVRAGFHYQSPTTGLVEWMPSHRTDAGRVGLKVVGYHPDNPSLHALPTIQAVQLFFDTTDGRLVGLAEATLLTALRTGAASAVATRILASPESRRLGLIGAGAQALTQLHAISRVLPVAETLVFDFDPASVETFAERAAILGLETSFRSAPLEEIVASVDVLCTSTCVEPGQGPVFPDGKTKPWLHVNAVGSDFPGKTELPRSFLERALVCPDFTEQAMREGECQLLAPERIGPSIVELASDPQAFAQFRSSLTVFDSTGWALEDHVAFELLLRHAQELGVGTEVPLDGIPRDPKNPYSIFETREEGTIPLPVGGRSA